ncbi:hypothetical protein RYD26_11660 [Pasteurellaceae bacterium LIM206]|nr:hypothetical protein [Pasteurellaceae bacterium LIM206]
MKAWLNLLPWRDSVFRRQRRQAILSLSLWLGVLLLVWSLLFYLNRQVRLEIQAYEQSLQQQQTKLTEMVGQNNRLRSMYRPERQISTPGKQVEASLHWLSELPFTQGRLTEFSLKERRLHLTGMAINQSEFERINQFLTKLVQPSQVRLVDFSPQNNGTLHFQFELLLETEVP